MRLWYANKTLGNCEVQMRMDVEHLTNNFPIKDNENPLSPPRKKKGAKQEGPSNIINK